LQLQKLLMSDLLDATASCLAQPSAQHVDDRRDDGQHTDDGDA